MSPQITFRADASITIGTGHVMRCLTLADALTALGAKVSFACSPETPDVAPALRASKYPLVLQDHGGDLLVIDHYGLDAAYEKAAKLQFRHIMVIDDLPTRPHNCTLLLDQTYGRLPDEWQPWVPQDAHLLIGGDYLLLRPEFERKRPLSQPRRAIKTILVTLGGTDPDNVTETVLNGIEQSGLDVSVTVIMGQQAPHLSSVARKAKHMKNVQVHVNALNMADMMSDADLAIGAGGSTAWERCCLSLPTIMLQIADNQKDVIQSLVQAGAAIECSINAVALSHTLTTLYQSPETRHSLSQSASRICKGDGAKRTAQAILTLLKDRP